VKVGFRISYQRYEATYVALQVARLVQDMGLVAEILPIEKPATLQPSWDRLVIRNAKITYTDWLKELEAIFFMEAPSEEELKRAKEAKVKTYQIAMWDSIAEDHIKTASEVDKLICPARCIFSHLRDTLKLKNLTCVPWDPGIPITYEARDLDPEQIALIWPLESCDSSWSESRFRAIENTLQACPNAWLTVIYSNTTSMQILKDLRRLSLSVPGRVELFKNLSWDRKQLLYGRHDLTIWPSISENTGLTGLCSIYMGTPVLAFDHPVIKEIVVEGQQGILVPSRARTNWLGVPQLDPNYEAFEDHLVSLLQDAKLLANLRQNVNRGLARRRKDFQSFWQGLLG